MLFLIKPSKNLLKKPIISFLLRSFKSNDFSCRLSFNLKINDLSKELNACPHGVMINDLKINNLLYADDIVLISDCPEGLNQLLNVLYEWCHCWWLMLNIDKSKVIHFRPRFKRQTKSHFWYKNQKIDLVESYKYLIFVLESKMRFKDGATILAEAGDRALSSMIS